MFTSSSMIVFLRLPRSAERIAAEAEYPLRSLPAATLQYRAGRPSWRPAAPRLVRGALPIDRRLLLVDDRSGKQPWAIIAGCAGLPIARPARAGSLPRPPAPVK